MTNKKYRAGYVLTLLPSIATLIMALLIYCQLNETQEQTKLLRRTLMQSYRPIGYISHPKNELGIDSIKFKWDVCTIPNKFSFTDTLHIVNKGTGLLLLIGYVSHLSTRAIDFREELLNSGISNIEFDAMYSDARRDCLLPEEKTMLRLSRAEIDYKAQYYLYILLFYQDGNLYDTCELTKFPLKRNEKNIQEYQFEFDSTKGSIIRQSFNCYSLEERGKLVDVIKSFDHPLANFLERAY